MARTIQVSDTAPELTFERTHDFELVREIIAHPDVYRFLVSDGAPSAREFEPGRGEHLWYILVRDRGELLGMFLGCEFTRITLEVHTLMFPGIGGRRAILAYREGLRWLAKHSHFRKVMGMISEDNPRALVVALRGGLEKVGTLTKSIQRGGVLLDQTVVAASI